MKKSKKKCITVYVTDEIYARLVDHQGYMASQTGLPYIAMSNVAGMVFERGLDAVEKAKNPSS